MRITRIISAATFRCFLASPQSAYAQEPQDEKHRADKQDNKHEQAKPDATTFSGQQQTAMTSNKTRATTRADQDNSGRTKTNSNNTSQQQRQDQDNRQGSAAQSTSRPEPTNSTMHTHTSAAKWH